MKRKAVAFLLFILVTGRAEATIPTYDYANMAQQLLNYASMLTRYYKQVEQYRVQTQDYVTQTQMLDYTIRNAQDMQNQYKNMSMKNLSALDQVQTIMNSAVGMSNDTARMQTQFETLYPESRKYQNQSSVAYSQQAADWAKVNQDSARDTLRLQTAIKRSMDNDVKNVKALSGRSNSASGTKDLLQIANQLLAMQVKELINLTSIVSSIAKADAAYMAENASKQNAAAARAKKQKWGEKGTYTVNPNLGKLH